MDTMLTFKEKKYAQKLITNSKNLDAAMWPEWGAWVLFALGGFLTVSVIFITLENLHATSIKFVFLPGITMGLALMLFGAFIQHISTKAEEQKIIAGLLKKLMV